LGNYQKVKVRRSLRDDRRVRSLVSDCIDIDVEGVIPYGIAALHA
jgi:hypothetical protein